VPHVLCVLPGAATERGFHFVGVSDFRPYHVINSYGADGRPHDDGPTEGQNSSGLPVKLMRVGNDFGPKMQAYEAELDNGRKLIAFGETQRWAQKGRSGRCRKEVPQVNRAVQRFWLSWPRAHEFLRICAYEPLRVSSQDKRKTLCFPDPEAYRGGAGPTTFEEALRTRSALPATPPDDDAPDAATPRLPAAAVATAAAAAAAAAAAVADAADAADADAAAPAVTPAHGAASSAASGATSGAASGAAPSRSDTAAAASAAPRRRSSRTSTRAGTIAPRALLRAPPPPPATTARAARRAPSTPATTHAGSQAATGTTAAAPAPSAAHAGSQAATGTAAAAPAPSVPTFDFVDTPLEDMGDVNMAAPPTQQAAYVPLRVERVAVMTKQFPELAKMLKSAEHATSLVREVDSLVQGLRSISVHAADDAAETGDEAESSCSEDEGESSSSSDGDDSDDDGIAEGFLDVCPPDAPDTQEDDGEDEAAAAAAAPLPEPAAKRVVEQEMLHNVHFLTCGQRCWDWFNQRLAHVTGSVAQTFLAFGRQLVRKHDVAVSLVAAHATAAAARGATADEQEHLDATTAATARARDMAWCELHHYFIDVFRRLRNVWLGQHKGSCHTRIGTANDEAKLAEELRRDAAVDAVYDVGLAENKRMPWLACSTDLVATARLDGVVPQQHVMSTRRSLPVELKTMTGARTINKHTEVARHVQGTFGGTWGWCSATDDAAFRRLVPSAQHRSQLVHQAATFNADAVVYVVGTVNAILYKVVVLTPRSVRTRHVRRVEPIATALLSWMYSHTPAPPAYIPFDDAEVLVSQHEMWWAVRHHVLQHGAMHPVFQLRSAVVVLYNNVMGGVDAVDRGTTSTNPTSCISFKNWQAAVTVSLLHKGCFHNAVRFHRLLRCRAWLQPDKWRDGGGWTGFTRRLAAVGSTQVILRRMGEHILLAGGKRRRRRQLQGEQAERDAAAMLGLAGGASGDAAAQAVHRAEARRFREDLLRHGPVKRRRTLLSHHGVHYRQSSHVAHAMVRKAKRSACAFCYKSVQLALTEPQLRDLAATDAEERPKKRRRLLASQRKFIGGRSYWQCADCGVHLCTKKGTACVQRWHQGEAPEARSPDPPAGVVRPAVRPPSPQ